MTAPDLKPCPFCGADVVVSKQRIAACRTEGCAAQHRGIDLDCPAHVTAWNRRADLAVPDVAALVAALRKLHHAVCGETGFAQCVRNDSRTAYPWPALDEADALARAALSRIAPTNEDAPK